MVDRHPLVAAALRRITILAFAGAALATFGCDPAPRTTTVEAVAAAPRVAQQDDPTEPDEEPVHDPCDGKTCGDACQLCPPDAGETCVEPPRQCDANGMCVQASPACIAGE